MCGQITEVRYCPCEDCALYEYRMGHNPARKGLGGKFKGVESDDNISE